MSKGKYSLLDPKVDYIFKQIFGQNTPVCNKILLNLLNSIFERAGSKRVKSVEYVNPYLDKEYNDDKQSILDIRVVTDRDETIDIEMQVSSSPHYVKRSLWYWASLYEKQLEESQSYGILKKSIVVNLLNFNLQEFKEIDDYHNVFEIKERRKNIKLTDDLEIHYVELKKLQDTDKVNELDNLSKWTLFFKDVSMSDKDELIKKLREEVEEIDMAAEILERVSQDEHERAKYESRLKWILERNTFLYEADKANKEAEEARRDLEEARKESEEARKESEEARKESEEARNEAEEARNEAEQLRRVSEEARKQSEEVKKRLEKSVMILRNTMEVAAIAEALGIEAKEVEEILSKVLD